MVLCIGEILADLIGEYDGANIKYERFVGGAPLNVSYGIKNLGGEVGFIGSVGDDIIGNYLYDFCTKLNYDYLDLYKDPYHNTTLAFVENDLNGERSFSFFRQNTADYHINYDRLSVIKDANIIHVGSLMLREEEGRRLATKIFETAKKENKLISFDVNFRDDIFPSFEVAKQIYTEYIKNADILKFSIDEVKLFTGNDDCSSISSLVRDDQLVFITLGSKGSYLKYKDIKLKVDSIKIKAIDTTGAGDAFYACVLRYLDELTLADINLEVMKNILKKANLCGALACGKKGAISSLPSLKDLEEF